MSPASKLQENGEDPSRSTFYGANSAFAQPISSQRTLGSSQVDDVQCLLL